MRQSYRTIDDVQSTFGSRLLTSVVSGISRLFNLDSQILSLKLKKRDVVRGQVFIDDMKDTYEEECPTTFNMADLISILYDDFIKQIQNGNHSNQTAAEFLIAGKERYIKGSKTSSVSSRRELSRITEPTFLLEDVKVIEHEYPVDFSEEMVYVDIKIKDKLIERSHVFLQELEPYLEGVTITLEDILVIRYSNFIYSIRNEGNNRQVMLAILNNIE